MDKNQTRIAYCKKRIAVAEKMIHEAPTQKGRDAYKKVLIEENKELKELESTQSINQKP
jgi:hypothetical protein